ncbi:MAG TPA: arginine deiminase-related protein [Pedobacter sp.]
MVRPVDFKFNPQTAENNKFQQETGEENVQEKAIREFDAFVTTLRENDLDVTVIDDTLQPETPDSIFPNNWISTDDTGRVFLYPMFSENRRFERRADIIETLGKKFEISGVIDLSSHELKNAFLEGTGSMVLDRSEKIAYACLSPRTDEIVIAVFCEHTGFKSLLFNAVDGSGFPIYHTNVMMCIAEQFAVICLDAITNPGEKDLVVKSLETSGKEVISITMDQMNHFAGNMLQVRNKNEEPLLILSKQAFNSLTKVQIDRLEKYNRIVSAALYTIEKPGGGSARCMLAEIHLNSR